MHSCGFYFAALLIKTYFTLKGVFTVFYEGEQKTILLVRLKEGSEVFFRGNNFALFGGQTLTEQQQCVVSYFYLFSVLVYRLVYETEYLGRFDNIKLNFHVQVARLGQKSCHGFLLNW